jgi:hypothetical protein
VIAVLLINDDSRIVTGKGSGDYITNNVGILRNICLSLEFEKVSEKGTIYNAFGGIP